MKTLTTTIGLTMILATVAGSARADDDEKEEPALKRNRSRERDHHQGEVELPLVPARGLRELESAVAARLVPSRCGARTAERTSSRSRPRGSQGPRKDARLPVRRPCVLAPDRGAAAGNTDALNAFLDDVITHYQIDQERVYLTGLSMGRFGTWELGCTPILSGSPRSRRFAAAEVRRGPKSSKTWPSGHSTALRTEPSRWRAEAMIKAAQGRRLRAQGHDLPGCPATARGPATYNNPELYTWFPGAHSPPAKRRLSRDSQGAPAILRTLLK